MKLAKYFVFATAIFLLATPISASDPESTIKSDNVAIQFRLTKLVFERAHRTTFWIEMKADRMGLGVSAVCDLRKDGVGVGRFPLEQFESREEGNAVTFRISCLQDDFIEDTVVHVLVRDDATGKTIESNRLRPKDAEPTRRPSMSEEAIPEVDEATAIGNVESLTGKWKAVESSHRALDAKLVKSDETGFEIAIDRRLGDSHRRSSVSYFDQYAAFLEKNGHATVATGTIKFEYAGESEFVISRKDGSPYLWYGIVNGGNPRIFLGRGSDNASVDTLAIEWTSSCSDSPVDVNRNFATVVYERAGNQSGTAKSNTD